MKKRRGGLIQLATLAVLGAAVILTLAIPQLPGSGRDREPTEVSVLIRGADSTLWANARLGMEQAAGDLGAELRFLTPTQDNDARQQRELIQRELERGAQALVVVPIDGPALSRQLKEVRQPVVSMESELEGAALAVTPDNQALGRALAQAVAGDWTGQPVLLLDTAPASAGVSQRLQAAQQALEQAGIETRRRSVAASELLQQMPTALAETGAGQVVAFEPAATEQAAQSKESADSQVKLYGVGVTGNIAAWLERGTIEAAVAWSDYAAGYLALQGAVQAARGGAQAEPATLSFSLVRGEDIYDADNQKLLFPVTA